MSTAPDLTALHDSLLMRTLRCEPTPRRPLWLMRQAGRYLPEYLQVRAAAGDFLTLVKTPAAASEVTLQPIERFGLDAAIIFSDILIVPDAMDLGLGFVTGEGPKLAKPLTADIVKTLSAPAADHYRYLYDAIALTRRDLPATVPLIGFAGAPFTLACYMIDGSGGAFWRTRAMYRADPALFHQILSITADAVATLLIGQLAAGCQTVMLFDSWGGLLADDQYETFSLQYIRRIIRQIKEKSDAPIIVFGRQCALSLAAIANSDAAAVGVDWQTSIASARKLTDGKVALQGNMDPAVLLTDTATITAEAQRILTNYGTSPGHIFNLGHGIDKNTPPENVAALVAAVKEHKI